RLPSDFALAMRIYHKVIPWSMVPVLMLGFIVSIVKFAGLAALEPGPGVWGFAVLTFMLTAFSRLDAHRLWFEAERAGLAPASALPSDLSEPLAACEVCGYVQPIDGSEQPVDCQRCSSLVHKRKPNMHARVWA